MQTKRSILEFSLLIGVAVVLAVWLSPAAEKRDPGRGSSEGTQARELRQVRVVSSPALAKQRNTALAFQVLPLFHKLELERFC